MKLMTKKGHTTNADDNLNKKSRHKIQYSNENNLKNIIQIKFQILQYSDHYRKFSC